MSADPIEVTRVVLEGVGFVAEMIARFIAGDDSEPVRRVIDVLPDTTRAKVEFERQRELTRKALAEQFAARETPPA